MQQRRPVRRALLSVSGKADVVELTRALSARGVELLSTEGTAHLLAEKGLPVTEVPDYTGFPEMMGGRVRALHPKVHGGILGYCGLDGATMEEHQILLIDMVVVNLYPFVQAVTCEGCSLEGTIEDIDIGSPTMMRSAAKNHKNIAIVVKGGNYGTIIKEMDANGGSLTLTTRFDLTIKAFEHTAAYDSMIANYFGNMVPAYHGKSKGAAGRFPCALNLNFIRKQDIRYDGSSHQQAAFCIEENAKETSIATATQVQDRTLPYNNIADTDATLECVRESAEPACVIVRHANPCGVAIGRSILDAYDHACKTDPTSTFGGIIAFNRELDTETTQAIISRQFVEVIIAPPASEEALKITAAKQDVRVLACGQWGERVPDFDFERVNDSLLVQDHDLGMVGAEGLRVVTKRQPSEQELHDTLFCWKVVKSVKSDAIVYAENSMAIDIGTGQISRVYSIKIADIKAADGDLGVEGSSVTSDTFFPSRDGIDAAATVGVTCVVQPGGSIRDDEVIAATDEHSIAMLFIGIRHFRH